MSKELQKLVHHIKEQQLEKKYAKTPAKKLCYMIYEEIKAATHDRRRSWDLLVELLATYLGIITKTKHMKLYWKIFRRGLFSAYMDAALKNPEDHIGAIYMEEGFCGKGSGQNMTPKNVVDFMIKIVMGDEPMTEQTTQMDPCVGTGRFLFRSSLINWDKPLILYGVEIALHLYKAGLVNMKLYATHPYYLLCADSLLCAISGSPGSVVWLYANRWDPPSMSWSYWKPSPIGKDRFSLKAFTELNK